MGINNKLGFKLFLLLVILSINLNFINAQIGGTQVYEFLTLPVSARAAALGGSAIAINDNDINLATDNPSLFSAQTHNKLSIAYLNYTSDINLGNTQYSRHYNNIGTVGVGLRYLNGGTFMLADENGNISGQFSVSELALSLSYAKQFDSTFAIGASFVPVYSQFESYNSFGLLMNIGANYTTRNKLTTVSIVFKNLGAQISVYDTEREKVPFEIQLGVSTKLEHAPFRFSIVAQQLQKPNLTFTKSNYVNDYNIEQEYEEVEKAEFLDQLLRHFIFGVEFIPTKNFFIRGGFNYYRRQELKLADAPGMAGFSWGFGFKVSKLQFSYANARYNNASISNLFSVTTNLSSFIN